MAKKKYTVVDDESALRIMIRLMVDVDHDQYSIESGLSILFLSIKVSKYGSLDGHSASRRHTTFYCMPCIFDQSIESQSKKRQRHKLSPHRR
jgi:hypothetical protein